MITAAGVRPGSPGGDPAARGKLDARVQQRRELARPSTVDGDGPPVRPRRRTAVAEQPPPQTPAHVPAITVSVTAPGRVGASRLDAECGSCGARESRYVPRGTVRVQHVCGAGWQTGDRAPARATG
jgi:hypothetical protein